jgi:hypothetical protein
MSKLKALFVILSLQVVLLAIGYLSITSRSSSGSTSINDFYVTEYMMGYSLPVLALGVIVFSAIAVVYRKPKRVFRKITITDPAVVNHRIPAYGNS